MLPTLITDRLTLRPFTRADLPAFHALHQDPEVVSFMAPDTPWALADTTAWLDRLLDRYAEFQMGSLAVVRSADNVLLGRTGLAPWVIEGEIELGYLFGRAFWGQGYATEAAIACRDFGFAKLHLPRIVSIIANANTRSSAIAERLGFQPESERDWYGQRATLWVSHLREAH